MNSSVAYHFGYIARRVFENVLPKSGQPQLGDQYESKKCGRDPRFNYETS